LNLEKVDGYVSGLKALLGSNSFLEQKSFLRSFIKRIEIAEPQIVIDYTIPPVERLTTTEEVLRIDKGGSRGWTRTNDPAVNSRLLYQLSYSGTLK
jgi:hypothetical protein